MKKHLKTLTSILMCMMLVTSLFPVPGVKAADGPKDNDYVKYYYDSDKPEVRTGYKQITLAPYIYKDVTNNTKKYVNTSFLQETIRNNLLDDWSQVAYELFESQGKPANFISYEAEPEFTSMFGSSIDADHKARGGFNLQAAFADQSTSAKENDDWGEGYGWYYTPLTSANSLSAVRTKMGDTVIAGINSTYSSVTTDKLLNGSGALGERLKKLNVKDKEGNPVSDHVFYKIATRVDTTSNEEQYESYGIAFYDIEVVPIADEHIQYLYPGIDEKKPEENGNDSGSDATPANDGNDDEPAGAVSYYENNSLSDSDVSLSFDNSITNTISSSVEMGETITFGQKLGFDFHFGKDDQWFNLDIILEFTFEEAFSQVYTKGQAKEKKVETNMTAGVTLPAQTAAVIQETSKDDTSNVDFNTPCVLSYKVAIFSLGGNCYTDAAGLHQDSRKISEYCTIFGCSSADGGKSAVENLKNRWDNYSSLPGFESQYGNTYGIFHSPGATDDVRNEINWSKASVSTEAKHLAENIPLMPLGTTFGITAKNYTTNIEGIIPMYPLDKVTFVDYISPEYTMNVGETFPVKSLYIEAYNENNVEYYGFTPLDGHWVLCDKNGNEMQSSEVAEFGDTPSNRRLLYAKSEGVQYIKWVLNDDAKYSSMQNTKEYATNDTIKNETVAKITVNDVPFDGTVELSGTYTGYVGDPETLLTANGVDATVIDSTGKEVNRPLIWEAKELPSKGISVDEAGNVTFTKPGTFHVRAYTGHGKNAVYPDGWVEVKALEAKKLSALELSDKTDPKTLAPFKIDDGDNTVDLSKLTIEGKDQYGDSMVFDPATVKYLVNGQEAASNLIVTKPGTYRISVKSGNVVSNELTLEVGEKRKLSTLEISSDLTKDGLQIGSGYEYDLKDVTVTAKDQYGKDFNIDTLDKQWTTNNYASINGDVLTGDAEGKGSLTLKIGDVTSNTLEFDVKTARYPTEFYATGEDMMTEGVDFDIDTLTLKAKYLDEKYTLTEKEIKSIKWTITDEGSIDSDHGASYSQLTRKLSVSEGTVGYGKTGTVILEGTLTNPSGSTVTGKATVKVRQKPVIDTLSLKTTDGVNELKLNKSVRCMDFFTVTAKDQYGNDYNLEDTALTFTSSNPDSLLITNPDNKDRCTIKAVNPKTSSDITVKASRGTETVESNAVEIKVPRIRVLTSIKFTKAPENIPLESTADITKFGAVCYDEEGEPFTAEELAEYDAEIIYSMNRKDTDSEFDADSNIITTGTKPGYISVNANAANISTKETTTDAAGNDVTTETKIWVGPDVDKASVSIPEMNAEAGKNTAVLTGKYLTDGMKITVLDENGDEVASANTEGSASKQTASFTLPKNTSDSVKTYTLNYKTGSVTVVPNPPVTITVDFHEITSVDEKKPTCEKAGYKAHYRCSKCSTIFADDKGEKILTEKDIEIKALGHKWDNGKVKKKANSSNSGIMLYTCKNDKSHTKTKLIEPVLLKSAAGSNYVKYNWTKVSLADGYDVFFGKCGKDEKESTCRLKKTTGKNVLSCKVKGLTKKKTYKAYIKAFRKINGKKVYISRSYLVHSIAGNSNKEYTNPKKLTLKKSSVTLNKGSSYTIKSSKITPYKKKLKLIKHEKILRYATSDSSVATVSASGKITAKKKGTCSIYVICENGLRKEVKVTVK